MTPSDQLMKVFQAGLKQIEIDQQSDEKLKLHTADDADGLDLGPYLYRKQGAVIRYKKGPFIKSEI